MRFAIITPGKTKLKGAAELLNHYIKMTNSLTKCEIIFVKQVRNRKNVEETRRLETAAMLAVVPKGYKIVALDEHGEEMSTQELYNQIQKWTNSGARGVAFLVGSSEGLDHSLLKPVCDKYLSLSKLTMAHDLARVVLAEQLFRIASIYRNHPYHRE